MPVHDAVQFAATQPEGLPSEAEARRGFDAVAGNVRELLKAPVAESYSGPVLFEGASAAQLLAQLIGDNLRVSRRPVSEPGRPIALPPSDFETRLGSRVLPEWIDVVDDATQTEWHGKRLVGHYPFDMEGVPPRPVVVVEKGVLKSFITTRQPVKGASTSTGHARLQGNFGARTAAIGNLFVKASETKSAAQLKAQFIELCKQRGKPYGLLVRKLDYPSSASMRDLRAMLSSMSAAGGSSRPVSPPVLIYRVYPDGREELVRGLRFRGLTARNLRDIVAASDEPFTFDFVNNGAPFAMIGAGGFLAPTSVVAPALLFDEVELERAQDELSKPPIVPPPPLEVAGR
jgi:TldD protein